MLILQGTFISSTEASLKSKDTWNLELTEECHPCCGFLWSVHAESAVFERKEVEKLAHDEREYSSRMWSILEIISVHEKAFATRVTMQVATEYHLTFAIEFPNHSFYVPIDRVKILRWNLPAPIQILTGEWASVVTVDDTIWIEHRHNFEDKIFSQGLRLRSIAHEELNNTFHHPTCIWLSWVYSRWNEDSFLSLTLLTIRILFFWSDRYILASVSG